MQKIREYPDTGEFQAPSILIDFLSSRSFTVWEGQLVAGQIMSMLETLANNPSITRCLEIGFNGGLSAATILSARPNISLVSVDIGLHEYVLKAKNTIDSKFPGRHTLVIGDSLQAVPQLAKLISGSFDFIFIDGGHEEPVPRKDIENCLALCTDKTLICIDDWCEAYGGDGVNQAIEDFMKNGTLLCVEQCKSANRGWGFFQVKI
jgi:hypothetical protein